MDQYEEARLRYEKKLAAKPKAFVEVSEVSDEDTLPPVPVPKEKPARVSSDCVIEVKVRLPDGELNFSLIKTDFYSNVNRSKANVVEIKRAIQAGLRPLIGEVK